MVLHIVLGCLLLVIPVGVLYLVDKKSLGRFFISVARMTGQVMVLCLMVWALISYDRWWLSLLWILMAVGYTAFVLLRNLKQGSSRLLVPMALGLLSGTIPVGLYLLVASLPVERVMEPQWLIPVMLLLLGHSLSMTLRGMNTYLSALKTDEQQYEFLRGNGSSHLKAVMPFVRRAVLSVMSPTIANLQTTGLYAMPLLVCGFLLAGVQPLKAFVIMVILTIGCVASSVISLISSLWLADRKLFDSFGKMKP